VWISGTPDAARAPESFSHRPEGIAGFRSTMFTTNSPRSTILHWVSFICPGSLFTVEQHIVLMSVACRKYASFGGICCNREQKYDHLSAKLPQLAEVFTNDP
jgi:hypothetical protein